MATNEVFREADHISLPVIAGTKSGDPVKVGSLFGVAVTDRDSAGNATVWRKGAFRLTVSDAVTGVGTPVYFTDGSKQLSAAGTGTPFGYALETKTAAAAPIAIAIAQV